MVYESVAREVELTRALGFGGGDKGDWVAGSPG